MRIYNPCWMSDCQSHTHQMSLSFLEQHLWRHYNCRLECQTVRLQDQSQNQDYLGLHWSWDGSRNKININGHHWPVQYHTYCTVHLPSHKAHRSLADTMQNILFVTSASVWTAQQSCPIHDGQEFNMWILAYLPIITFTLPHIMLPINACPENCMPWITVSLKNC